LTALRLFFMIGEQMRYRPHLIFVYVLCLLSLLLHGVLSVDMAIAFSRSPGAVAYTSATLLIYAFIILRRPDERKIDHLRTMTSGLMWGVAVGSVWIVCLIVEPAIVFLAALLPILGGALGAIATGKVRSGTLTGFWCGIAGGLFGFLVFATQANIALLLPSLFAQPPDDPIVAAFLAMPFYGLLYCPLAGTIGGLIGIPLDRTGHSSISKAPVA